MGKEAPETANLRCPLAGPSSVRPTGCCCCATGDRVTSRRPDSAPLAPAMPAFISPFNYCSYDRNGHRSSPVILHLLSPSHRYYSENHVFFYSFNFNSLIWDEITVRSISQMNYNLSFFKN